MLQMQELVTGFSSVNLVVLVVKQISASPLFFKKIRRKELESQNEGQT
jgi:hypothetical protein